jgi:hypothetical protein
MAVFYVLPARTVLGECLARMLRPFVPGVALDQDACADLVESLVSGSTGGEEYYVVHREDLPDGEEVNEALREGFGAEDGDRVVLVSIGPRPEEPQVKVWDLKAA